MRQCRAVRKKDENRLHVAEMRMVRWIRGKPRKDHIINQVIQEDAKVCQMSTFLRQKRLNWYGHIRRTEEQIISQEKLWAWLYQGREEGGGEDWPTKMWRWSLKVRIPDYSFSIRFHTMSIPLLPNISTHPLTSHRFPLPFPSAFLLEPLLPQSR